MLGIDYQRAKSGEVESGGDSPAFGSQRRNPVCWGKASTGVRLDRAGAVRTGVWASRKGVTRAATALYREDDGLEPGTSDTADWPLYGQWQSGGQSLSPAPLCCALHDGRCRAAGLSG